MKRPASADSLGVLMSICPNSIDEFNQESSLYYTRENQTVLDGLDEEGCDERSGHASEKKRRLTVDQVKALEKNFEVENKLEPDRKVKLAQEIGLQPRQVAVWFQNRRARYKTKQLERDYGILKANYDKLKLNYDNLQHDNESLLKEVREIKSKLHGDVEAEKKNCVKEEGNMSETEEKCNLESPLLSLAECEEAATELDFHNSGEFADAATDGGSVFLDFKDGSSDSSDSSAVLNEENRRSPFQFLSPSFGFPDSPATGGVVGEKRSNQAVVPVPPPVQSRVKVEEHDLFEEEESCSSLFSDDQPPTLHWYSGDHQWNN